MTQTDWSGADAIALGVLAQRGGLARIDAFLEAGLTRHQIAAIFRRRILERPRRAWYADPELPWQAKRAIRVGGVACCVTAAALWGLPVPPGAHTVLHVHVANDATRLRHNRDKNRIVHAEDDPEVLLHRSTLADDAVWRTSLVDTLLQLARCVPMPWFVAALDAALHRPRDGGDPLLSDAEFARLAHALPRRRQAWLAFVDPSAESPIESLLRVGLLLRGIGPVMPQFQAHRLHRVDFLVGRWLIVEADGAQYHDPEADAVRDALLATLGYLVLRFGYDEIVFGIDAVLDMVELTLVGRG